jgi:hypothetical protein
VTSSALQISAAFNATGADGKYSSTLQLLSRGKHSGVYAILDRRSHQVLYIGESHSGRLFDTITRHFRSWSMPRGADPQGRRRGGEMYERSQVAIAYALTPAELAQEIQYAEIQRLRPRDNDIDGCGAHPTAACDLPV